MDIVEILLQISKEDLKASKLLYENKFYPHAVFYLQQSVEKAAKSLLIALGLANYQEIKSYISHEVYKIIKLYEEKLKDLKQNVKIVIEFLPGLKDSILNEALGFLKIILNIPKEVEKISERWNESEREIEELIKGIREGYIETQKLRENDLYNKNLEKYKEFIQLTRKELHKKSIDEDETTILEDVFTNSFFKEFTNLYIPLFSLYSLFQLSILTFKHVVISRYTEPEIKLDPLRFYNKDTPIIKKYNDVVEITELILKELENREIIIFGWNKFKELLKDMNENLKNKKNE